MSDAIHKEHDALARELYVVEREIANLTRWQDPSPDSIEGKKLAAFQAKLARLAPRLIELAAAMPAKPSRLDVRASSDIKFKAREWHPAGSLVIDDRIPELPACLRRAAA